MGDLVTYGWALRRRCIPKSMGPPMVPGKTRYRCRNQRGLPPNYFSPTPTRQQRVEKAYRRSSPATHKPATRNQHQPQQQQQQPQQQHQTPLQQASLEGRALPRDLSPQTAALTNLIKTTATLTQTIQEVLADPTIMKHTCSETTSIIQRYKNTPALQNPTHLMLVDLLTVANITEALRRIAKIRNWKASTTLSRLGTLIGLTKEIDTVTTRLLRGELKRYERSISQIQEATWEASPHTITEAESIKTHLQNIGEHPELRIPIILTWICGQRLGDVLLWRRANIVQATCGLQILVVEYKSAHTGPYTITLPTHSLAARILSKWLKYSPYQAYAFIPLKNIVEHNEARSGVKAVYARMKTLRIMNGDIRGLRRGGLSAMTDLDNTAIMTLSRHKSAHMLRRYLGAGRFDSTERKTQAQCIALTEAALLTKPRRR